VVALVVEDFTLALVTVEVVAVLEVLALIQRIRKEVLVALQLFKALLMDIV
jgi:hypothetical protein